MLGSNAAAGAWLMTSHESNTASSGASCPLPQSSVNALSASMSKTKRHYGIDINSYLGVEFPQDRIDSPSRHRRPQKSRRQKSGFAFRDSIISNLSRRVTPSIMLRDTSNSIRRWGSSSREPPSTPSTPMPNRDKMTTKSAFGNATPTGNTTFLPTLHSTPPMPTFQKPDITGCAEPVTPTNGRGGRKKERAGPPRLNLPIDEDFTAAISLGPQIAHHDPAATNDGPHVPSSLNKNDEIKLSPTRTRPTRLVPPAPTTTCPLIDRLPPELPSLPTGWSAQQDRAICMLDSKGWTLSQIVAKIKVVFPGLKGPLMSAMVDKRLRQLDQRVEVDYWRVNMGGQKGMERGVGKGR